MRRSLPGQLENQLKAQWGIDSLIAIGSMSRGDQAWDCEDSRTKAQRFAEAVNTAWSTDVPIVQLFIDVADNQLRFGDAETGCEPPPALGGAATRPLACLGCVSSRGPYPRAARRHLARHRASNRITVPRENDRSIGPPPPVARPTTWIGASCPSRRWRNHRVRRR
jgi:hypothetical protein